MKNLWVYLMVVAMLAMLGWAFYVGGPPPVNSRKSKPPKKIKHPSEIKTRKDICYGTIDAEGNSGETLRYYVQA
jgi:hypothetical protein